MKFKSKKNGKLTVELEPGNLGILGKMGGAITELKNLLVPIDFSECSRNSLKYAIAFAKQFDAKITLIAVVNDHRTPCETGHPEYVELQERRQKMFETELKKLAESKLNGMCCGVIVREGRPFEEIVGYARKTDADMIIIATHGRMGMLRGEIGSTAERVVRYAPCPVLVVRERERDFVPQ